MVSEGWSSSRCLRKLVGATCNKKQTLGPFAKHRFHAGWHWHDLVQQHMCTIQKCSSAYTYPQQCLYIPTVMRHNSTRLKLHAVYSTHLTSENSVKWPWWLDASEAFADSSNLWILLSKAARSAPLARLSAESCMSCICMWVSYSFSVMHVYLALSSLHKMWFETCTHVHNCILFVWIKKISYAAQGSC